MTQLSSNQARGTLEGLWSLRVPSRFQGFLLRRNGCECDLGKPLSTRGVNFSLDLQVEHMEELPLVTIACWKPKIAFQSLRKYVLFNESHPSRAGVRQGGCELLQGCNCYGVYCDC